MLTLAYKSRLPSVTDLITLNLVHRYRLPFVTVLPASVTGLYCRPLIFMFSRAWMDALLRRGRMGWSSPLGRWRWSSVPVGRWK